MLVLSRKNNEKIIVGDDIEITVTHIQNGKVKIGIKAPEKVRILRGELLVETTEQKSLIEHSL